MDEQKYEVDETFEFKEVNDEQKREIELTKEFATGLLRRFDRSVPKEERSEASRLMNIARTNLEQSVMWAVKAITRK